MNLPQEKRVAPWWQMHENDCDEVSYRNQVKWDYNKEISQLAKELLSRKPTVSAHGLQVTNLTRIFQSYHISPILITRQRTREVYDAVFNFIMEDGHNKALVLGAPGIGKSRNLLYLIKQLLEANQLVLYHDAMVKTVYAFVPLEQILNHRVDPAHPHELDALAQDPDRYTVFHTGHSDGFFKCAAMEKMNTVFVHDPAPRPHTIVTAACRMVLNSYPDREFYKDFLKYSVGVFRVHTYYLSPCSMEEAVAFNEIMRNLVPERSRGPPYFRFFTADEIRRNYTDVGGNLFALSSKQSLDLIKGYQKCALITFASARFDYVISLIHGSGFGYCFHPELVHVLTCFNDTNPTEHKMHDSESTVVRPAADSIMLRLAALSYPTLYDSLSNPDYYVLKLLCALALTGGGEFFVQCLSVLPPRGKGKKRPQFTLHLPAATAYHTVSELTTTNELLTACPAQHVAPFIPELAPRSPAVRPTTRSSTAATSTEGVHAPQPVLELSVPASAVPTPTPLICRHLYGTPDTATSSAQVLPDYPQRHILLTPWHRLATFPAFGAVDHTNRAFVFAFGLNWAMENTAARVRRDNVIQSGGYTAANPLHVYYIVTIDVYKRLQKENVTSFMNSDSVVEWVLQLSRQLVGEMYKY